MSMTNLLHCPNDGPVTYSYGTSIFEALDQFEQRRNQLPKAETDRFPEKKPPEPFKPSGKKKGRKPFEWNR